jgi:hypothetical protein
METINNSIKQPEEGDRRKAIHRRIIGDRREIVDRRSVRERRFGWGKINAHLLRGAQAATASIVFQFSRPFTIIIGYVDLLLAGTREEDTKKKLVIVKEQLQIISEILDDFREVDSFKTKDFDGVDILDTSKPMDVEQSELDRKIS